MAREPLGAALNALINTQSPADRVRVLLEHADLILCDRARDLLETNLSRVRAQQDREAVGILESVLSLVDTCRKNGLEPGVANWRREAISGLIRDFTQTGSWGDRKSLLERFTEDLVSDKARELLDEFIELNSANEDVVKDLRDTARILDAVREHGIEPVFGGIRQQLLEGLATAAQEGRSEEWDWLADSILGVTPKDDRPEIYGGIASVVLGAAGRDDALTWIKSLVERGVQQEPAELAGPKVRLVVGKALMHLTEEGNNTGLDDAIELLNSALEEFSAVEGTTIHGLHGMIAVAHLRRSSKDRRADLKVAQRHLEEEICATSREVDASQWAYSERMLGRVLEMLGEKRAALQHFELGVDVSSEQANEEYLDACMSIAGIRMDTYGEDRAEELKQAIEGLESALSQAEEGGVAWARIHRNLGDAYRRLQIGDPSKNMKTALEHVNQALSVFDRDRFPDDWAQLQHNLGTIHYSNQGGDRADNIERALACYRRTLEVHTRTEYPQYFGLTNAAMGMALLERIAGSRNENLSKALERLEYAVVALDREESKTWWAECQTALGMLYMQRRFPDRRQALLRAIECMEAARVAYTELGNRQRENQSNTNLAAVFTELSELDGKDHPEALRHAKAAVANVDRGADPFDWAIAQQNLAVALIRSQPENSPHGQALDCLNRVLDVFTEDLYPAAYSLTNNYIGHIQFDQGDWQVAQKAYNASIRGGEAALSSAYTEAGRRERVSEIHLQHVRSTYCLLRLGRPAEGLVLLEHGKTRLLGEALALAELDLTGLPKSDQDAIRSARQAIGELEAEMRPLTITPVSGGNLGAAPRGGRSYQEFAEALHQARAELKLCIERIRSERPDFMPTGLELPVLLDLIPEGGALVAPLFTSKGSAAFVVPHGTETVTEENVIEFEDVTDADLTALLQGPTDELGLAGWLGAYSNHCISPDSPIFQHEWWNEIEAVGEALWDRLLGQVHERLKGLGLEQGAPILLLPQGGLGLLPLHAAWRHVDGVKRYFLDDWTVTYVPSGYALSVSRERLADEARQKQALLAVINPTGDLEFTLAEGQAVTALFADALLLPEEAATLDAVMNSAPGRQYLHFSCHGRYDWDNFMQSALILSEIDKPLTVSRIIAELDLDASRLVTLSACETGLTDIRQSPDEYLGLPAGFLQAGAPAVVSTLWPVDDRSTMLLMERFYRNLLGAHEEGTASSPPAAALRNAQIWLRDVTNGELAKRSDATGAICAELPPERQNFDHPYHWAAFTFSGA